MDQEYMFNNVSVLASFICNKQHMTQNRGNDVQITLARKLTCNHLQDKVAKPHVGRCNLLSVAGCKYV